jgi:hypothetical protein
MVKKKHIKREHLKERRERYIRTPGVENVLVENFVSLQRVMSNLSVKFDELTNQISKLLELFEISAKTLAEKDYEIEKSSKENSKILEKIENVLEQNKTIAKGLSLMHDRINEPKSNPFQIPTPRSLPQRPLFNPSQKTSMMEGAEEYHRPISSNEQ